MDVRRVQAYIYEILGEYNLAIEWYQKAIELLPT
jgi:tetratricopeptide (TPR) repeat protein